MKKTLASNMPKREQYVNREIYSTNNWNTGDVYAYRLHGEFSKEKGLYNKYEKIENLHKLIKNNGKDFNLTQEQIELAEKLN